jgi:hypothetical protein
MKRAALLPPLLLAAAALLSAPAWADAPEDAGADSGAATAGDAADAGAAATAGDAADAGPAKIWASCAERVPEGATRPTLEEAFPARGFSGYVATLEVTISHGKGETVLPEGFKVQAGGDAARALAEAGFVIPEADAGVGATLSTTPGESGAVTKLSIPFVPLPKDPGRNAMILPPVPVAVARASGELVTVCTAPHPILVEDPIANELDPKVKPNPPPRPQREEWVLARQLTIGLLLGTVLGGLLAYLIRRWQRRPKVIVAPPPRPPWEVALEELDELRRSSLLTEGRNDEHFDRVSDCVRKYLGARYGFDGLETTTDEMRGLLKRVRPPVPELKKIGAFLSDCDLVKFARVLPEESDCIDALRRGEQIVRMTIPAARRPAPPQGDPKAGPKAEPRAPGAAGDAEEVEEETSP